MAIKRIWDVTAASVLLALTGSLMVMIALAIKLDSKGTAIFKQERVGRYGAPFTLYKFRTMHADSDPLGPSPVSVEDQRITRTGRFLRKFQLDELPQLYNILKGDMSFVGPRPQLEVELEELKGEHDGLLEKRLTVPPGLTSTWAIAEELVNTKPSVDMLDLDSRYVDEFGLRTDAKILAQTMIYLLAKVRSR